MSEEIANIEQYKYNNKYQNSSFICKNKVYAGNKDEKIIFIGVVSIFMIILIIFSLQIAPLFFIKELIKKDESKNSMAKLKISVINDLIVIPNEVYNARFMVILTIFFLLCALYNYICCFFKEPGIIPKADYKIKPKEADNIVLNNKIPRIFQNRYCETCHIIRPPKASHCSKCNHCVNDFDQ